MGPGWHAERGYVLPAVLAALLLFTVVASWLDARVTAFRQAQGQWAQWAEARAALLAAREELLLALATQPLSAQGFGTPPNVLRVDGRPYRLPSGVLVSVQDMRGLIGMSTPDPTVLRNFLVRQGVADGEVEPLLDKLADYADVDDLRRLNGAEKDDYAALGLPPPRNDWPISAYELSRIVGWADRPSLWARAGDYFTAAREGEINPNTAPREVLLALPGATPEGVAALLARRAQQPFESAEEVLAVTGIRLAPDHFAFHPGLYFRLRLWLPQGGPGALEYNVMLTPNAPRAPWQILEVRTIDRPTLPPDLAHDAIEAFPFALAAPPGR